MATNQPTWKLVANEAAIVQSSLPRTRTENLARLIAGKIGAYHRCLKSENHEWKARHLEALRSLEQLLPSGSGIDSGTKIDIDRSTGDRLVFSADFHHMNDGGMYDGWTEHTITVRASLEFSLDVRISGRNRNEIKEYLGEVFSFTLGQSVVESYDPATDRTSFAFVKE